MKSIMEQASSIIKAIEKAWISADKPKEFSVKIFEKEEKNFFGMTTKPAKIGIFFSDRPSFTQDKNIHRTKPEAKEQKIDTTPQQRQANAPKHTPKIKPTVQAEKQKSAPVHVKQQEKPAQQQKPSATWNDTMINAVTEWINRTLSLMGMTPLNFTSEVTGRVLKLTFAKPVLENELAEKHLFRSIAHLIMASLRNQYKQEIKDLKIVLIRPQ